MTDPNDPRRVTALVAEDDPISSKILEGLLQGWGYRVVVTNNGSDALRALEESDPPQVAILDWVMPGLDGNQVCQALRAKARAKYVYILLVTDKTNKDALLRGLEAGADDYLTKPYDPFELRARLAAGRRIVELQEELIAAREAMRLQAMRDSLTGLWNRRGILDALDRELARSVREGHPLGVVMGDLDHFKRVNDTLGHGVGDVVLRGAARRLAAIVRPYDSLGRYGGEEFLAVLPGCDLENAKKMARRLCDGLSARPIAHGGDSVVMTISAGVASTEGRAGSSAAALLAAADAALYAAKQRGRNRVEAAPHANAAGGGADESQQSA
jgi:diguanylate cyclase (GGDEF)-like protein